MWWPARAAHSGCKSTPWGNSASLTSSIARLPFDMVAGVEAAAPAQLAAANAVEIVIHGVNQAQGLGLPPDADDIPGLGDEILLAVAGNRGLNIPPVAHANLHQAGPGDADGPAGQRVGVHGQ